VGKTLFLLINSKNLSFLESEELLSPTPVFASLLLLLTLYKPLTTTETNAQIR